MLYLRMSSTVISPVYLPEFVEYITYYLTFLQIVKHSATAHFA